MAEVVLAIPARPAYLHLVRQVISAAARLEPSFPDDRIDDLRLAVSEAVTNAVEAQRDAAVDELVVLRCDLGVDRIQVEILDRAGGFDPSSPQGRGGVGSADDLDERGYGLPLIRQLADETDITTRDDGTAVRLTVYVPARFRP